jgi:uncharacterized protein YdaL
MKRLTLISLLTASLAAFLTLASYGKPGAAAVVARAQPAAVQIAPQTAAQRVAAMAEFRKLPKPKDCRKQKILVLYGSTGAWGYLGEIYALFTANLAGRWADYDAMPAVAYRPGGIERHALTVYIGSTFGETLPKALVHDIAITKKPVLWMQYGLNDLARLMPGFRKRYGFLPGLLDHGRFDRVDYRGVAFTRGGAPGADQESELATAEISDSAKVQVLATATRADGVKIPWAIRSGNLTFVSEIPYVYMGVDDRYLVFADLMTGLLAPNAPQSHRALVRIEDVGPDSDPAALMAMADYLYSRGVPFSVAVYDTFADPLDSAPAKPRLLTMAKSPKVIAALKYMESRGGTLLMHGHTHQFGAQKNPYNGKSAADFEFFLAHIDDANAVVLDGPPASDSRDWALRWIDKGLAERAAAGLPRPTIFEFPHDAGSALDYSAVASRFAARYERSMYFTGTLGAVSANDAMFAGQFFPYPVRDVYGQVVLPEDMGNDGPHPFNQHPARTPAQMLETAARDFVLQDGFASFFHHWYLGLDPLKQIVEPMQAQGWTFVTAGSVVAEAQCR